MPQASVVGMVLCAQARTYPPLDLGGKGRDTTVLFSALIGFGSRNGCPARLLNTLDNAHLDAVIAHEQAHFYYRDTFWFFWLGWVTALPGYPIQRACGRNY